MNNQLNMYPMIEFERGHESYWYPNGDGWDYGVVTNSTSDGVYTIDGSEYNSIDIHPFVFVDPKYAIPDVHDHSFVCKIEHNQS